MSRVQSGTPYLALLLASAIACLPSTAAAQNVTGTLAGTIVDEQGSLIPGASITVINELTADSRATVSDDQGNFQVTTCRQARIPCAWRWPTSGRPNEPRTS